MSEPKLREVFQQAGLVISEGQISNLLIQGETVFERESEAVFEAGVSSSDYQHLDDTSTSVDGVLYYCHILCNPYYTAYFTLRHKDRLSVLKVLQGGREPKFMLNEQTLQDLALLDLPLKWQHKLSEWSQGEYWNEKCKFRFGNVRDSGVVLSVQSALFLLEMLTVVLPILSLNQPERSSLQQQQQQQT
jgi:hypothetical protein